MGARAADYHDHGLVFAMENGDPINPEAFSDACARQPKATGFPRIRIHDVRLEGGVGGPTSRNCHPGWRLRSWPVEA
jgi:hypothetical protein